MTEPHSNYHIIRDIDYSKELEPQIPSILSSTTSTEYFYSKSNLYQPFLAGPSVRLITDKGAHYVINPKFKPSHLTCKQRFINIFSQPYRHYMDIYVPNHLLSSTLGFKDGYEANTSGLDTQQLSQSRPSTPLLKSQQQLSTTTKSPTSPPSSPSPQDQPINQEESQPKTPVCFYVHGGGFHRGSHRDNWRSTPVMSEFFTTLNHQIDAKQLSSECPLVNNTLNKQSSDNTTWQPPQSRVTVAMTYSLSSISLLADFFYIILFGTPIALLTLIILNALLGILYWIDFYHHYSKLHTDPRYYFMWGNLGVIIVIYGLLFIFAFIRHYLTCQPRYQHPQHSLDVFDAIQWCDENLSKIVPSVDMKQSMIAGHSAGASIVAFVMTEYRNNLKKLQNVKINQIITISGLYNYKTPSDRKCINFWWWALYTTGAFGYCGSSVYPSGTAYIMNERLNSFKSLSSVPNQRNNNNDNQSRSTLAVESNDLEWFEKDRNDDDIHWLFLNAQDDMGLEHTANEMVNILREYYGNDYKSVCEDSVANNNDQSQKENGKNTNGTDADIDTDFGQILIEGILSPIDHGSDTNVTDSNDTGVLNNTSTVFAEKDKGQEQKVKVSGKKQQRKNIFRHVIIPNTTHATIVNRIWREDVSTRDEIYWFMSLSKALTEQSSHHE